MQCPQCHHENRPGAKFCEACAAPAAVPASAVHLDRDEEIASLRHSLAEAIDRQTATSEILSVISTSPTDVQPVFDAIARHAVALCGGVGGIVVRYDGMVMQLAAYHNVSDKSRERHESEYPRPPDRTVPLGAAIIDRTIVHVPNLQESTQFAGSPVQRSGRASMIAVPLLRHSEAIGAIGITRDEPQGFSDRDIALLETFADQAVIAIENARLFTELQTSNRDLTTALDTQTATSEILRVISQSQTDVRPVFEAIISSAIRLMGAEAGALTRIVGDSLELAAFKSIHNGGEPSTVRAAFPLSLHSAGSHAKAVRDRAPVNIAEAQVDRDLPEFARAIAREVGYRSMVVVPMLHHDVAIGTISATRLEPGGFANDEIALLQTFADQAVIAIENVRLFTETKEALEQQTATADILGVISGSPTDVQPVFEAIAESAVRLCSAEVSVVTRFDGTTLELTAVHGVSERGVEAVSSVYPMSIEGGSLSARAVRHRDVVHVADVMADPDYGIKDTAVAAGWRSALAVPMWREQRIVGVIFVGRASTGLFGDSQVELLKTFADQAVIAIENARLFNETREALDQQTATAEILRVISSSPTDLQPVFAALLDHALTLCEASNGSIYQFEDGALRHVGLRGPHLGIEVGGVFPLESSPGRAILEKRTIHLEDILQELDWHAPEVQAGVQRAGLRTIVAVPLLREQTAIGAIVIRRLEVRPFSEKQIRLLKTFADQAVIAIENVRLFTELQARTRELTRSVGQLTALGDVARAVGSTLDLETVLDTIVSRAIQLSGTDGGSVYEYDEATEEFSLRASRDLPEAYVEQVRDTRPRKGEGAVGRVALAREPVQIADISNPAAYESRVRNTLLQVGLRALLAVPLISEDRLVGALIVMRKRIGTFAAEEVTLLQTFATQSALAIQNARLFREIEVKSRQLEVASQHKSEFLANMSHELRTPLNAIIGFSEVLTDRMFGELNEKQEEYLKDIYASGTHLLSLINDILDLSKIEAGRMELELTEFDLPSAIENALTLVRERAGRRSIALHTNIDNRLGQSQADERKVRQVVLNLLSNAIKFTPEGGRIDVGAVPKDGFVEVSVRDTGIGIAPEDQEKVFEEFRQVGTAAKKIEGTGLGLTLCRKFVELHGGRIWVKSELGVGSTFTFTIPVHRGG